MHITDVTMYYGTERGGVQRYLQAKRRWLQSRVGFRHTLVVPRRAASRDESTIDVPSLPMPFVGGVRLPLAKGATVRAIERLDPDVIEAGDPYRFAWAALAAGRKLGTPVVGFYHADFARAVGARCGRRAERWALAYLRRLYSEFDLVFAPSAATVKKLRALGVKRAQFQPLGVDTATFHPRHRSNHWREQLDVSPEQRLLVYVGRFAPEKNIPVLLEALKPLGPRYVLALVGNGSLSVSQPNVRVIRYVPDTERLAALMASSDAFVHAGDEETFGLTTLEAMACGLPAIVPDAGGLAELVDDEVGLCVPPHDPDVFAEAIEEIFLRDTQALGAAARKRAERYDWNRVLPRIIRHYAALRGRAPIRARIDEPAVAREGT